MAFMYSGMLEKYLHTFYTHIKGMYFLSKKKNVYPHYPVSNDCMALAERLNAHSKRYKTKGQAGPLSTNIVLLRLLLRMWNTENRYDCQKCAANIWQL